MRYRFLAAAAFLILSFLGQGAIGAEKPAPGFIALSYHNLEDNDPDQSFIGVTT